METLADCCNPVPFSLSVHMLDAAELWAGFLTNLIYSQLTPHSGVAVQARQSTIYSTWAGTVSVHPM
jgi:hypothetical protein